MIESIYFYKNGYFDGVNKGGNGGYIGMGLYNGKFDIKEKLSDTSYLINLRRIDYDTNTGKEKDINFNNSNWHFKYTEALFFSNDMVGKDFVLYLPKTKFSSLDENEQINMKMLNHHISNDMINIYAIEKKQDDYKGFMTEFIKE